MRQWIVVIGFTLGFLLLAGIGLEWRSTVWAASQASPGIGGDGLITHVDKLDGNVLRVVVVDPVRRVMGAYDISRESGEIQLKSVRDINADLQMLEFNSAAPSPSEIQGTLQRK